MDTRSLLFFEGIEKNLIQVNVIRYFFRPACNIFCGESGKIKTDRTGILFDAKAVLLICLQTHTFAAISNYGKRLTDKVMSLFLMIALTFY